jgi:hypothetical protein
MRNENDESRVVGFLFRPLQRKVEDFMFKMTPVDIIPESL